MKVLKLFIKLFKILLILSLLFVLVYTAISAMEQEMDNTFRLIPKYSQFGISPTWSARGQDSPINDIYDRMGAIGAKQTAYEMYITACKNLMLSKNYGIRASSSVTAYALDLQVDVVTNRIESFNVTGTPSLNANQAVESSYQNTIYISKVSDPALSGLLQKAVQIADRVYVADNGESYKQKGKLSAIAETGEEEITWPAEYVPEQLTAKRNYADSDVREKSNFIINADTILDSVTIDRLYDEENKMYFYTVDMYLDCSGSGEEGSATYYEYHAIFDLLGSNMKGMIYNEIHINFTMYENGFFITWDSLEDWTVDFGVAFIRATANVISDKKEVFTYDYRDCAIVNFTV